MIIKKKIINNKMNTIIDELVQMGLLPEDGEVLKAYALKYQCCSLYDLISVRIPKSETETWAIYHSEGISQLCKVFLRVLVGLTFYIGVNDSHKHAIYTIKKHFGKD